MAIEVLVPELWRENWENVRHIKNERLWFTNIYAIVVAATLSFLHGAQGDVLLEVALLSFLVVLAVIGLVVSLRLKAELEDVLVYIKSLAEEYGASNFFATGENIGGPVTRHLKFRWVFPLFYGLTGIGSLGLLIHDLVFKL